MSLESTRKLKSANTSIESWTIKKLLSTPMHIPQFQRTIVWKKSQRIKFIESLKLGLPTPSILLYEISTNQYALIDGLQRYSTLWHYDKSPLHYLISSDFDLEIINNILDIIKTFQDSDNQDSSLNTDDFLASIIKWFVKNEKITYGTITKFYDYICAQYFPEHNLREKLNVSLEKLLDDLDTNTNIDSTQIPVCVYKGSSDFLHEIFYRLNRQGTYLSKYDILSAMWQDSIIRVKGEELVNPIFERYEKTEKIGGAKSIVISSDSQIKNLRERFQRSQDYYELNLFEYLYGLEILLTKKFPVFFTPKTRKLDHGSIKYDLYEVQGYSFNNVCLCLGIDLKLLNSELSKEIQKFTDISIDLSDKNIGEISLESAFLDAVQFTYDSLEKILIDVKLNKSFQIKKIRESDYEKYHTDYQMCSLIAFVFRNLFIIEEHDNLSTVKRKESPKQLLLDIQRRIKAWYLYDLLSGERWSGTGDQAAFNDAGLNEKLNFHSRYEEMPKLEEVKAVLDKWFRNQLDLKSIEKNRKTSKEHRLFLRYLYSSIYNLNQLQNEYHIEHLIPFSRLTKDLSKSRNQDYLDTRNEPEEIYAVNHIANLSLLDSDINVSKGDKTIKEYFLEKHQTLSKDLDDLRIKIQKTEQQIDATRNLIKLQPNIQKNHLRLENLEYALIIYKLHQTRLEKYQANKSLIDAELEEILRLSLCDQLGHDDQDSILDLRPKKVITASSYMKFLKKRYEKMKSIIIENYFL